MATLPHEIASLIETFIRRQSRITDEDPEFSRDAHLYESSIVDSAGVVELILFVETTFGVKLEDEHIFSDQFTTINGITAIVRASEARPDQLGAAVR
jgi:acyl carrier protein